LLLLLKGGCARKSAETAAAESTAVGRRMKVEDHWAKSYVGIRNQHPLPAVH